MSEGTPALGALACTRVRPGPLQRVIRAFAQRRLLGTGAISLAAAGNPDVWLIDDGTEAAPVRVEVLDPRFYRRLLLEGSLGGGRAWIERDWDCDELTRLLRAVVARSSVRDGLDGRAARVASGLRTLLALLRRNSRKGSRRNIAAHYDLGNELFERMLDPTMTYSSAVFEEPTMTLERAQSAKYERICSRLGLSREHEVLEIGTGWGGFAVHAADRHGCHVTTTTISREQHAYARELVHKADLANRVTLLREDYRDLVGQFDRLVSIEMIEAVGAEYLPGYFRTCSDRLRPDGAMSIQAIVIGDQDYQAAARHVDFIKEYIFPGGHLPSIASIAACVRDETDLRIQHLEDITADYAETLRRWAKRLDENEAELRALGYDDEFMRMWRYYLAYCEAGFEERHIGCVQIALVKPGWRPGAAGYT
jgi:cyclopropane-fatty-acyl-phospholipid synthase